MTVRRIIASAAGSELAAARDFDVDVLGLRVAVDDPVVGLQAPAGEGDA